MLNALLGMISCSFLSAAAVTASLATLGYCRCCDLLASLPDPRALWTHLKLLLLIA